MLDGTSDGVNVYIDVRDRSSVHVNGSPLGIEQSKMRRVCITCENHGHNSCTCRAK